MRIWNRVVTGLFIVVVTISGFFSWNYEEVVRYEIKSGENLAGANLGGKNLVGINLHATDLSGAYMYGANLVGANLVDTIMNEAKLQKANLTNAELGGASLINANLVGANLVGANLFGTDLTGANLLNTLYTDATDVLATNRFCIPDVSPCISKWQLVSAVSHRRMFIEGGYWIGASADMATKRKVDACIRFAANPTFADWSFLIANGVDYFFVDHAVSPHLPD